jgi:ABC-type molybdate transport system substrate-binding protein
VFVVIASACIIAVQVVHQAESESALNTFHAATLGSVLDACRADLDKLEERLQVGCSGDGEEMPAPFGTF